MQNSYFSQLIEMAAKEPTRQRFLLVFVKAQAQENKVKTSHQSGTITPIMCVDKLPEELISFDELKKEADSVSKNWDFVIISSMSGTKTNPPSTQDAGPNLKKIADEVIQGALTRQRVILNRNEEPIILS